MFNKLSFDELAKFYGALADMEKHYGKQAVREGIKEMSDRLDGQRPKITYGGINLADLTTMAPVVMQPGEIVHVIDKEAGLDVEAVVGPDVCEGQLELLPFEPEAPDKPDKKTRVVKSRKQNGYNKIKIQEYFSYHENNPNWRSPDEMILKLYYQDGKTQSEIGKMIGVNQRAVSQYLNAIPEKRKRKIMAGWGNDQ